MSYTALTEKETKNTKCTLCGEKGVYRSLNLYDGEELLFFMNICKSCKKKQRKPMVDYFFDKETEITDKERGQLAEYLRDKCEIEGTNITRTKFLKIKKHIKKRPIDIMLDTESTRSLIREIRDDSWDAKYREVDRKRKLHR